MVRRDLDLVHEDCRLVKLMNLFKFRIFFLVLLLLVHQNLKADPPNAPGYDAKSGFHREVGGAFHGDKTPTSRPSTTGTTTTSSGTKPSESVNFGGDNDDSKGDNGSPVNQDGVGLSFGPNIGSTSSPVLSSGNRLSFPDSVTNNNTNTNINIPNSANISMGLVVRSVQSVDGALNIQGTTTGKNGGFDKNGNFYDIGTPVPSLSVPSKSLVGAIASLLDGVAVVGFNLQSVSTNVVNGIGRIVEPQIKALSAGFQSSLNAAQNTQLNSLAELSKPEIRNALIETGDMQNAMSAARRTASNASQVALYAVTNQKYNELGIPEDRRWLAMGPASQANRHIKASAQDIAAAKIIDQSFLQYKSQVIVPDRYSIQTPGYLDITEGTGFQKLNAVQKVGVINSITVITDKQTLSKIAEAYGYPGEEAFGFSIGFVGPTLGGLVIAATDAFGANTDASKASYVDTITHEYVHAGDNAILADIAGALNDSSLNLSKQQVAKLEERLGVASSIYNNEEIEDLSENLKGLIRIDKNYSNIFEVRAYTQSHSQGNGLVHHVMKTQNISETEATAIVDKIKSDPVLSEINRVMTEHATEILNRDQKEKNK